ncbi:MAG: tRNA lysidine(34) synthetase TilS [Treponema sp.]|nr:tRNA lysidine(34) synthetase TilS [Treponema sp.]
MKNSAGLFITQFVADVRTALCICDFNPEKIHEAGKSLGAAVSGGADSVALLVSLAYIAKETGIQLHVITVNHNIRPAEETGGDAAYVQHLCTCFAAKGFPVDCTLKELTPGAVDSTAQKRGNGIEEAARYLRYKAFNEFAGEKNVMCICLAHNRNDQLETLLMRFFQGSGGSSSGGIQQVRGIFVRPLLSTPRSSIERFLTEQHILWRTDSTNSDTHYLRNRIRHIIMPELDSTVPGWQKAVLAGGKKAADADEVVAAEAERVKWQGSGKSVYMPLSLFISQKKAVQVRLFYAALELTGCEQRIPYSFIERVCIAASGGGEFRDNAAGITAEIENGSIFIKKNKKTATDFGFSVIIEKSGTYETACGTVCVVRTGADNFSVFSDNPDAAALEKIQLPFCIRSRQPGDEVRTASGGIRSVSDILSDWKVCAENKDQIPVIQALAGSVQPVVCIWGSVYGYDDWIVMPEEK